MPDGNAGADPLAEVEVPAVSVGTVKVGGAAAVDVGGCEPDDLVGDLVGDLIGVFVGDLDGAGWLLDDGVGEPAVVDRAGDDGREVDWDGLGAAYAGAAVPARTDAATPVRTAAADAATAILRTRCTTATDLSQNTFVGNDRQNR